MLANETSDRPIAENASHSVHFAHREAAMLEAHCRNFDESPALHREFAQAHVKLPVIDDDQELVPIFFISLLNICSIVGCDT